MPYSPAQLKAARKNILRNFHNCYKNEDRASYYKGMEEEKIALELVSEGKLIKSDKNADMGGNGDKRYTYFCPAFDTFNYVRYINGQPVQPDARMKNWK